MGEPPPGIEEHRRLQGEAVAADGRAHVALMAGDEAAAAAALSESAALYRRSWEVAPPGSYGRLVGLVKAGVLAGDGSAEASYVRARIGDEPSSPPAAYALALAALVEGDDATATAAADAMRAGSDPFMRAAAAILALARADGPAYADAVRAIVSDFEQRPEHLTGVAIADTALVLEALAERRGLASHPASPVVPG